jgi:hypothetical protein
LTAARPEQVLRGAALLGATADELGTAISSCRRAAAVRWVGRANEQYQDRLAQLAADLVRVRTAFDTACEALLGYARALAYAQPLAEEAARLQAMGETARVADLQWQAEQAEQAAAARLLLVLHDLIDRAPRTGAWTTTQHDLANFAAGLDDAVKGVGSTVVSLFRSLPGVGSSAARSTARHEVVEAAEDSLQPWKQVQQLLDALHDGRGWRTSGEVAGTALLRARGVRGHRVDFFGAHDELPAAVMLVLDRGAQALSEQVALDFWLAEHLRQEFVQALLRLEREPLPSLDELDLYGVDLLHQEAAGGHALQRHLGRDADFLRDRQRIEPGRDGGPQPFSSFSTLDEAEALVSEVLQANLAQVRAYLASTDVKARDFRLRVPAGTGTVISARGELVAARTAIVRLVKRNGTVRVATAFLNP